MSYFCQLTAWNRYTYTLCVNCLTNILHPIKRRREYIMINTRTTHNGIIVLRFANVFCEYCWNCFIRRRQLITRTAAVAAEAFFYAWNSRGGMAAAVGRACGEKMRPAHAHQHVRVLMHVSPTPSIFQPLSGSLPSASRQ